MTDSGLRDMKKIATRQALAEAAFNLAVEHGVDGFVVEDIVKTAGYSRRTFANYFSCKEEAIANSLTMNDYLERDDQFTFSTEMYTPLDTIELYIRGSFTINKLRRLNQLISLSRNSPTLKLYVTGALMEVQNFAKRGISEEFGSDYPEEYYHILIGAVFGAILPVLDESIAVKLPEDGEQDEADNEFNQYIDIVFGHLRKGFN
ncbi:MULTISPECIES: TetR/AcrR family transcriptional regulator [unclassified Planococcus (in: firmicutes)]|uniref:TetR/AcrR family transcriptional regulator n=1 Tax=unclassified Planococcus (in: firmicutes) TaxID=2662419 RepID=UPI000C339453|nr:MULTISPECIES: TetR/AcrR family transcriptional regulator [unclassified Planococcus (in: firmicutes)]AUD15084.1 TetR family transcriptional regulator [Planococcus sp. MB-3u-03]PKG46215.1 TetR family transcriptional regulator [Planococcus sp. Urea-trap-24]PKG90001.1 TetR family transcriptional regulator [Planococcus sp. Urea-3u-39]PKH35713.1 TetR family transcriptional regulator [Planococcus sp. MB-3u-09]